MRKSAYICPIKKTHMGEIPKKIKEQIVLDYYNLPDNEKEILYKKIPYEEKLDGNKEIDTLKFYYRNRIMIYLIDKEIDKLINDYK